MASEVIYALILLILFIVIAAFFSPYEFIVKDDED